MVTTAYIQLDSGQTVALLYSATFGEVAVITLLIVVAFLYSAKWLYEICFQLWQRR